MDDKILAVYGLSADILQAIGHAEDPHQQMSDAEVITTGLVAMLLEFISIYDILCLQRKEAIAMGTLRFADLQTRPIELLDLTSLTVAEFQPLVPPFEAAYQAHMAHWRLDGRPRTARRYTTYQNCPLPTPEDRLLFILVYLKTYPLQVVQGRLFGMGQSKAHQWIHVLLVVLRATLRALGDAPSRSLTELAQRLGVAEAEVAAMVVPPEGSPPSALPAPAPASCAMSAGGRPTSTRPRRPRRPCCAGLRPPPGRCRTGRPRPRPGWRSRARRRRRPR
jgi:hypothetical protein